MTDEEFVEWIFVAPDEEVLAHGQVIRPGKVVKFKFDDASFILGINTDNEVAVNGEFWDLGDDVAGVLELLELFDGPKSSATS